MNGSILPRYSILAVSLVAAFWSPTARAAQDSDPYAVRFETFQLDNGLRVVLSEDHSAPTYSIAVAYDVGSRNEGPGQSGFAHLVEHLMFQGSVNVGSGEHFTLVRDIGGGADALTSADHTIYFETLPANQLDLGLFLESDRMRSLDFSEAVLDTQRAVVAGERRTRHDNAPYGRTEETILATAYDSNAYGRPAIPPMDDLERATPDDIREFIETYYTPNNAVVALAGDFDSEIARARVEMYFGDIPARPPPPVVFANERPQSGERRARVEDRFAPQPELDIVFRAPPGNSPQWYMMAILGEILAGEGGGRLGRKLVDEERMALDVMAAIDERRGTSLFRIRAIPAEETGLEDLEAAIDAELDALKAEPVEEWELEEARLRMERTEAERLQSTLSRAVDLAANAVFYDDPGLINRKLAELANVTREAVMRAAGIYFGESNRTVVTTLPVGAGTIPGGRRP